MNQPQKLNGTSRKVVWSKWTKFRKKKEKENSQLFDFQRESFHFRRETSGIGP